MTRRKPFPIGERFGRLVVVAVAGHNKKRGSYSMKCSCDCGAATEVREDCLKTGNTTSCGCAQRDAVRENAKHGMWETRTYRIWAGIKRRCADGFSGKKAHLYAGKGIKVCDRWRESFEAFLHDMGEAPDGYTIDRINGDGDYEPSNCRWATPKEQANNTTRNKLITHNRKTQTVAQWAEEVGIKPNTLVYRLRRGWAVPRALGQTVQSRS